MLFHACPGILPDQALFCLTDEIRSGPLFPSGRRSNACCLSGLNAFDHPCHIPAQSTHGLQALQILKHLLRLIAMHHIPVLGTNRHHVADAKVLVQHIKRSRGSATSSGKYGSAWLVGKRTACRIKQAVQERKHASARMRIVNRASENEAICLLRLQCYKIDLILIENAAPQLTTGAAANAVTNRFFSKLDDLGLHALLV